MLVSLASLATLLLLLLLYIYIERTENNNFSVVGAMTVQLRKGMCLIRKYPYPSLDLAVVYYKA